MSGQIYNIILNSCVLIFFDSSTFKRRFSQFLDYFIVPVLFWYQIGNSIKIELHCTQPSWIQVETASHLRSKTNPNVASVEMFTCLTSIRKTLHNNETEVNKD